jgi:hypothetical protein
MNNSKNFYLNANPFSEPKALVSAANSDVMKNLSQGKLPKGKIPRHQNDPLEVNFRGPILVGQRKEQLCMPP